MRINQPPVDATYELKLETAYDAAVGHNGASSRLFWAKPRLGPLYDSGIRGDSMNFWDMSLLKQTNVFAKMKLQIRAEALNAPNHANFAPPNATVTSSAFGQVTGETTFPRQLQFGFKVIF